jgi:hypothetical protein
MRVWVVEGQRAGSGGDLASLVNTLAERRPGELRLLGSGPLAPGAADRLRMQAPEILVVAEAAWPESAWGEEVLGLSAGAVVVTTPERSARFVPLAERHPLVLVSAPATSDELWLALLGARAAARRQLACREQLERLQQRLADRILIERAKGVLAQRLHITEDEAYNRLRVLSRRQRRPMREVAQSFLDTQDLLGPGESSAVGDSEADAPNGAGEATLPR